MLAGGALGVVAGGAFTALTYYGLLAIPNRHIFSVTTVVIALLAAGMAAQAAAFLEKANALTALNNVVWDTAWLLSDASIPGKALHTLVGYTDQPTAMQLLVYVAILAMTFVLMRLYGAPGKVATARG
jgi:high-affinity iron transporter